jgi:predicted nuclease of predicted toxin-antitoxin system
MRVLIDMNLSPRWEKFFVDNGSEARHWVNVGDPRASDEELLAWARREGFIVFTHDLARIIHQARESQL